MTKLKGSLIVIEGPDGVGRSTQVDRLVPWLQVEGYGVVNTRWARSALLHETINEAKAGHRLNVTTYSLLYAADFADRLENEIIPALRGGLVVLADRYMYTALARAKVGGADPTWSRALYGFALVPDLTLYLKIDVRSLVPRVLEGKGMDYWESGMHLALGKDIFDSYRRYQTRLIKEYNDLAREFGFVEIDARRSADHIQRDLQRHIGAFLRRRKTLKRTAASLEDNANHHGAQPEATPEGADREPSIAVASSVDYLRSGGDD